MGKLHNVFNAPENASTLGGDIFTTMELADILGVSKKTAERYVREAVHEGKIEYVGKVERETITEQTIKKPGYRVVEEGEDE